MFEVAKCFPLSPAHHWKILSVVLGVFLHCQVCLAEDTETRFDFDVTPGRLTECLNQLSNQSNATTLSLASSVSDLSCAGLKGKFTLDEAFNILLENTNLTYVFISNSLITIREKSVNSDLSAKNSNQAIADSFSTEEIPNIIIVGETNYEICCRNSPSTATKTYVPTIEVPQSLESIDSQLFRDRGNVTLVESLQDYTSTNIRDKGGNTSIRGFSIGNMETLKDGHPVVSSGITSPLLQSIDGIEIAKGPNSTLYGYGEPGGVINLITKKPQELDFTNLEVSYGNYDKHVAVDTNSFLPFDKKIIQRTNFIYWQEKSDSGTDGQSTQLSFTPTLRYEVDDAKVLDIRFEYAEHKVEGNKGLRPFDNYTDVLTQLLRFDPGLESTLDAFYYDQPDLVNAVRGTYYPNTNESFEDVRESRISELNVTYESPLNDVWSYSFSNYIGSSRSNSDYLLDVSVLMTPMLDPNHQFYTPLALEFFYDNYSIVQNNVIAKDVFEQEFDRLYGVPENSLGYDGIVEPHYIKEIYDDLTPLYPLWRDNQIHFYQQPIRAEGRNFRYSFQFNINGELEWGDIRHNLLFGISFLKSRAKYVKNQRYSTQLYNIAEPYLESGGTSRAYGWALRRYSQLTWYNPATGQAAQGVQLPDVLAASVGLQGATAYALDGSFLMHEYTLKTENVGFYAQDEISLSEKWKLRLAGGWYHYDSEADLTRLNALDNLTGMRTLLSNGSNPTADVFNPIIGLVYLPQESLAFYTNYTKQFNIAQNIDSSGDSFGPMVTTAHEVGSKWWPTKHISASITLFQHTKKNWLVRDSDPRYFLPKGELRSSGGEFNINGYVTPHFKVAVNYSEYSIESLRDISNSSSLVESNAADKPESNKSLWVQYNGKPFGNSGWKVGVGLNFVGDRTITYPGASLGIDSYTLFDLGISYSNQDFGVSLNIDNVTDQEWLIGYSPAPAAYDSPRYLSYGQGRKVRLNTELYY